MNPYNDELQKMIADACSLIYFMCGEWISCRDCPASVHKDTSFHIEEDTPEEQIMCAFGFDKTGHGAGRLDGGFALNLGHYKIERKKHNADRIN